MGKRSEVFVQGVMVPSGKLQREISRHVLPTLHSKFQGDCGIPGMNIEKPLPGTSNCLLTRCFAFSLLTFPGASR